MQEEKVILWIIKRYLEFDEAKTNIELLKESRQATEVKWKCIINLYKKKYNTGNEDNVNSSTWNITYRINTDKNIF